jgi:hypothetical protein
MIDHALKNTVNGSVNMGFAAYSTTTLSGFSTWPSVELMPKRMKQFQAARREPRKSVNWAPVIGPIGDGLEGKLGSRRFRKLRPIRDGELPSVRFYRSNRLRNS